MKTHQVTFNRTKLSVILRHLLFWIVFLVLWSTHDLNYHRDILENLQTNIFAFIPYAFLVYFNLYFLSPNFLFKKKIASYLFYLVLSIALLTWVSSKYLYFYFTQVNTYIPTANFFDSFEGKIAIVTEIILSLGLSMTLFLIDQWYRKDRSLNEIEQKRLEMELNLLKNQVNPHFLFNTLNSIYITLGNSLVDGKDMLLQFSDLLSYQIYETGKKRVSLKKEFENLINYIAIERVRHKDLVTVTGTFPENCGDLVISPMLLLPLIENAFKHGQSSEGYQIVITSSITPDRTLKFSVENTVAQSIGKSPLSKKRGIGLKNVKRRLELIYPNRHLFTAEKINSRFVTYVEIALKNDEMSNS
ncbi:histidine kinase [uncultured Croceitalea sp.]|uniref:sensor histidine kinase n=1 Tax=uncultured Croceitalea sp. TaxID=1798908 RepID=UPI0033056860